MHRLQEAASTEHRQASPYAVFEYQSLLGLSTLPQINKGQTAPSRSCHWFSSASVTNNCFTSLLAITNGSTGDAKAVRTKRKETPDNKRQN